MQEVFPTLRITDETRSRALYCDGLGFTVEVYQFQLGQIRCTFAVTGK